MYTGRGDSTTPSTDFGDSGFGLFGGSWTGFYVCGALAGCAGGFVGDSYVGFGLDYFYESYTCS